MSPRGIGTITTSVGAIFGGMRRPRSSPCVMISAPSMRHDIPHDVVQQNCCVWSSAANVMSYARAKFWPSSCEVADCSARPSGISASIE